jgi:hypothetical protein
MNQSFIFKFSKETQQYPKPIFLLTTPLIPFTPIQKIHKKFTHIPQHIKISHFDIYPFLYQINHKIFNLHHLPQEQYLINEV